MHLRATRYLVPFVMSLWMVGFACLGVVQAEAVRMGVTPARFEFVAYEGDEVEGTLQFANGMDEALSVHLEGAEFRPEGEAGKIVVGEPSDEGRSLAGWIVPVGGEHVVPPQVAVAIPFSLAVPRNAAPGLYWGVLVARTSGTVHLSSVVFLTVRGEAREGMSLESFSAPSDPSETSTGFVVRLRNTGETLLKPEGVVIVRTVWGREALALSLPVENVLPGAVRRLEIPLVESLGLGSYGAMLEIRYGLERRVIRAEATFRVVPWRKVLVVFSVLAAGGAVWVFGRRRVVPGGRAASVEEAH